MLNKRVSMILNSIEGITLIDFNILLEDEDFRKNFLHWFNIEKLNNESIIKKSVKYINNNF